MIDEFQKKYAEYLQHPGVPIGVFLAYFISAGIGLSITTASPFATLMGVPSGIALAVFLLYGYRVWPAVSLAAFLVNLSIGTSPLVAFGIAFGNTLAPLAGAALVKWYSDYHPSAIRLHDSIGIVASALLVPLLSASIGVASLVLWGALPAAAFAATWSMWWMGDALGILVCAPFILKWVSRPLFHRTRLQYAELALILITIVGISFFVFWAGQTPFAYVLFIPLTWAALRTGPRGVTLSLVLVSGIAIGGTLLGHGPFATQDLSSLQIFLGVTGIVFLIFVASIEERKQILKAQEHHVRELEIALQRISTEDEAKKEFLAILAHELRNPLATILSSIELLNLQGVDAINSIGLLEMIGDRSRAMVRLLDDLLDISRILQKKLKLQKETIAVDRFIDKMVRTAEPLLSGYGHSLSVTRPSQELYLEADPLRLEQILMNLLTNAAKYTRTPGTIDLMVSAEGEMLAFHLRDSGIGIPKNMLRRIFEPFFQIGRDQVPSEGLGVGLPLTQQLVEMHGGTIEAKSAGLNSGSEFIVRLPLPTHAISLPADTRAPRRHGAPRHVKRTFKILVVDDNKPSAEAIARLLELRGHNTTVAYQGSEAVKKAKQFEPDIVLLDIGLPDMNGYEVAGILRKQKKPYFLIALTGYGQIEDKERAEQAGFNHHLTKPAGLKEIEVVLKKVPRAFGKRSA